MWGHRLSLCILLIGMINAVLKIFISMKLPVWVFERPVLKCFQLPILQKWNFCLLEKWVGPQMQTWWCSYMERQNKKRLAGPKQQKAKFKSALLYPNGFWYIYQQLWNVASGLFKIITNSNFSLRVHIIIIKRSPSTLSLGFFFPVGSSKICFLTNAFSPLYSLPCFLLMISC